MRKSKLIFLIAVIIGGAAMIAFFCRESKYKDLRVYTEKLLEIKWGDCIETAAGDVKRKIGEEENAHIKLKVREGYEEEVLNILQNSFGKPLDTTIRYGYQGHEFATELENSNIQYIFVTAMEGKIAKTRAIRIYVVYDENNRMYIYVMG